MICVFVFVLFVFVCLLVLLCVFVLGVLCFVWLWGGDEMEFGLWFVLVGRKPVPKQIFGSRPDSVYYSR